MVPVQIIDVVVYSVTDGNAYLYSVTLKSLNCIGGEPFIKKKSLDLKKTELKIPNQEVGLSILIFVETSDETVGRNRQHLLVRGKYIQSTIVLIT